MKKFLAFVFTIISLGLAGCADEARHQLQQELQACEQSFEKASQDIKLLQEEAEGVLPVEFQAVELVASEKFEKAFSTADMLEAGSVVSDEYDRLMNKFYQELLDDITEEDREIVRQAQRDWITFRDSEMKLNRLLSKPRYGGGTMQPVLNIGNYMELVKERALDLYRHHMRVLPMEHQQ